MTTYRLNGFIERSLVSGPPQYTVSRLEIVVPDSVKFVRFEETNDPFSPLPLLVPILFGDDRTPTDPFELRMGSDRLTDLDNLFFFGLDVTVRGEPTWTMFGIIREETFSLEAGAFQIDGVPATDAQFAKVSASNQPTAVKWTGPAAEGATLTLADLPGVFITENDRITGSTSADTIDGGLGHDTITGGDGEDSLRGGVGNDRLAGNDGSDTINGGSGNDNLTGGNANDLLRGDAGDDTIDGGDGNDRLFGGAGQEFLNGWTGKDVLQGGTGHDNIDGGAGADRLMGGRGKDTLSGGTGNDTIGGGTEADTLMGRWGADRLNGGRGNDLIEGQRGHDRLEGAAGNDTLIGGNQNDTLVGGLGNDVLVGGHGADRFVFFKNSGSDTVRDFGRGQDEIKFVGVGGKKAVQSRLEQAGDDVLYQGLNGEEILFEDTTLAKVSDAIEV